ncbi:alpha/beta hydrolase [Mycobacterium sp. pV006]|uniref:alpha/beta hydrolase n=1 Tax=Mycobacterium sp. pV006 TaxID=3238983 RepID=UPI00351BD7B4
MTRDLVDRLDPALRHLVAARTDLSPPVLGVVRDGLNQRRAEAAIHTDLTGVEVEQQEVATAGGHVVAVRIYRGGPPPAPAVIYCHSGAFVLGNLDTDHLQCVELARRARCTVLSLDYRLAPEHPFPAAIDDAVAVLEWAVGRAVALGIRPDAVAVAGSSAGGALAAGLAQRAAAGTVPALAFTLLHQPVLDDRDTASKREFSTTPGFDGPAAQWMWRHYLSGQEPTSTSVPGRADVSGGHPPTLITCSELDPLRDEAIDYARALMAAGVTTGLHTFAGTCHGFDSLLPDWDTSARLFDLQAAALRQALLS